LCPFCARTFCVANVTVSLCVVTRLTRLKEYGVNKTFCCKNWPTEFMFRSVNNNYCLSQYLTNLLHKICFTISFISCLYMFRAHLLIIRRSKLHYIASGIITLKQVSGLNEQIVVKNFTTICSYL